MVRNGMQLSVVAASVAVQDSVTSCTDRTVDCSCNDTATTTTTEHGPSQPESIKSVQDERRVVMTVPVRHCWFLVHAFPLVCRNLFRALDCLVLLVVVLVDTRPTCSTGQCVPSSLWPYTANLLLSTLNCSCWWVSLAEQASNPPDCIPDCHWSHHFQTNNLFCPFPSVTLQSDRFLYVTR